MSRLAMKCGRLLTASMRIVRADNGSEVMLGELVRSGERPLVWSLDERNRMVERRRSGVRAVGLNEVFVLRLGSGREVVAVANAAFLAFDGWKSLSTLKVGDRLA